MPLTSLLLFAAALFIVSATPGPSVAALTSHVITRGWRNALPFVAALWISDGVWLTLATFGLGVIAAKFATAFLVLKLAGVGYLLFLAWKMWTASTEIVAAELALDRSAARMFLTGLAITIGNPKIMVFYLALLPAIVDMRAISVLGWAELAATMMITNAFVDISYIVLASQARRLLRSPAAIRIANRISAVTMTGAAAAIALDAA